MDQSALIIMQMVIIFLLVLTSNCQQHTFYIKPSNSSYCSEEVNASQCYDLRDFISGKHWLSAPNTTLLFLPGEHFLELDMDVRNIKEFFMIPYTQYNNSTKRISIACTNYGRPIHFQNVSFVKVDSISFHSCGDYDGYYGVLELISVYHSEITNSKWYESRGSAIFIQDSNTVMADCHFVGGYCSNCSGGGIQAVTSNVTFTGTNVALKNTVWEGHGGGLSLVESNILLDGNLTVVGNLAKVYNYRHGGGGGIYLRKCSLTATNTSFMIVENNTGDNGGGLYFEKVNAFISGNVVVASNSAEGYGGGSRFTDSQCSFTGYTLYYNNSCQDQGGGLIITNGHLVIEDANFVQNSASDGGAIASYTTNIIELGKVNIANNTAKRDGGGIRVFNSIVKFTGHAYFFDNSAISGGGICALFNSEFTFEKTVVFSGNKAKESGGSIYFLLQSNATFLSEMNVSTSIAGWAGGAIFIRHDSSLVMTSEVFIEDSHAYFCGGAIALDHSVLLIIKSSELTSNSAQYGGAIHALSSKLYFIGNHSIRDNHAQFGGGFSLSDGSSMYFTETHFNCFRIVTHIHLISNFAYKYGGAIWVEDVPFYTCNNENFPIKRCFWNSCQKDIYIFDNNTAVLAGSNIYGGKIFDCLHYDIAKLNYSLTPVSIQEIYFSFSSVNISTNSSPISSNPIRVCLCTQYGEPDCSISYYTIEVFSGQQFPLTLVGVGQNNGTVPAVILSHTDPPSNNTVKSTGNTCSTLFYTISSDSPSVQLMLYPESPCNNISTPILTVSVNIKPCPPGFMLHNQTRSCTCDDTMQKLDIHCDINSQSFSHNHGVWVDYNQLNSHNSTVLYHPHCPFDYCMQEWSNFTFNSSDNQCRYNRSGFICGACKEGYSLTLGGSKCTQCSHLYILLVLPLAVAGVVLVFFLLSFRLTVSIGTINGLIFFVNIIGTNSNIFLPPESTVVLRLFIAWINLDLGINTCLFDGLDMYTKVWLQFIFPFYVFFLTGIIIVISRYSTLFTRFLGSDPVAVLATLILLAYTKLFRTVLTVMSFTYIQDSDGFRIAVWLYDGNVRYLSGKHIPLFLLALLVLLLLIIPYTVILLFAPCLLRCSQNRFLFWIDDRRLKPFLFSYYAPLKSKFRSWISILLVVRLCLLILFVSNFLGDPSINLFAIVAVVIILLCFRVLFGTFYINWCIDALELFFIMNLGLFSLSTLYVLNSSGNQRALADTLVGIALTVFVAITVYHGWRQMTDSRWWRHTLKPKLQKYFKSKNEESPRTQEDDEQCEAPQTRPQVPTTFVDLRESLLDSS